MIPLQSKTLFMAPMEGITDVPFRKIVRELGCQVICTQMIHAEGLLKGEQHRMQEVTFLDPSEQPVGMQLCSSDPTQMAMAGQKAQDMGAAFIDINMGCPAKNVVARGAGAALLKDQDRAVLMVEKLKSLVSIPVTVKIRAGWDHDYLGGMDLALKLQNAGAQLLTIHARTRNQKFKGQADWNLIKTLKEKLSIPVVGNGDLYSHQDIMAMFDQTTCDGAMVARGALGNPWLFSPQKPTIGNVFEILMKHFDLHLSFYKNHQSALITFRKHIAWYTKGIPNSSAFRVKIFKEKNLDEVFSMLKSFFHSQY